MLDDALELAALQRLMLVFVPEIALPESRR